MKYQNNKLISFVISFVFIILFVFLKVNNQSFFNIDWEVYYESILANAFISPIFIFFIGGFDLNFLNTKNVLFCIVLVIVYDVLFKYAESNSIIFVIKIISTIIGGGVTYFLLQLLNRNDKIV